MLHVIATPIGNLGDLSPRALEAFKSAAVIACEDTRRTWQLLTHFGVPRPEMVSYRQGNEERLTAKIIADVKAGKEVALCSDGGYPGISDPGYRLIRACAKEGVPYEIIPGASAVNVALLMSGLPTSSFTFRGFPPRGPSALRNWFAEDADKEHTLICYESPFRVGATLAAAFDALGDREAAVCIELTKLHERVSRGYLSDLAKEFAGTKVKGEVAIVIAGANRKFSRVDKVDRVDKIGERGYSDKVDEEQGKRCPHRLSGNDSVDHMPFPEYELAGIETIARGVCIVDGKVLLCRGKGLDSSYLPGGHIEFGETGRGALVREMKEETGLDAEVGESLGFVENSFLQHDKKHCEINLVYKMEMSPQGHVTSQEDWIGFEWCPLADLEKANLLPIRMRELVREMGK